MLKNYSKIDKLKDQHSRKIKKLIDLIGVSYFENYMLAIENQ